MISSPEEEGLLIKWLLAEAIRYRNRGLPIRRANALKWASRTRMHKIMFSIFNEFSIPVTRSWYMWGGFIHSDILADERFTSFRYDYSRNPNRALRFRTEIECALDLPVEDILQSLQKYVDEVQSMPSRRFLLLYYEREAPEGYRDLYISKQVLSNLLDSITKVRPERINLLGKKIGQITDSISQFHQASLTLFDDDRLEEVNIRFVNMIETALDKLDLLVQVKKKISGLKLSFFKKAKDTFDNFIWSPYACKVSQRTITGIRASDEKEKMRAREERKVGLSTKEIDELESERKKKDLEFSWEEIQRYKEIAFKDKKTAKILSEILGIYGRAKERGNY